jgi:hypothetical protein
MRVRRATSGRPRGAAGGWLTITTFAQQARFPLPLEPIGNANEAIFPAYEGWGELQDGSGS